MPRVPLVVLAFFLVVSQALPLDTAVLSWDAHAAGVHQEVMDVTRFGQPESADGEWAGGAVQFSSLDLWRDYRWQVIVIVAVGVVQSVLIVGLLFERRRRHSAEQNAEHNLMNAACLDRRATLGEMSAALAHELNQPLGAIMHNAEAAEMAIESGTPAIAELREILADIRKEDSRAGEIISRMRAFLQNHTLDVHPLNVNELTRETLTLVAPAAAEKGVCVDLDLAIGLAPILGDRVHLQQVLINVLVNGMDAMATIPRARRYMMVSTSLRKHSAEIAVTDAGCGIPADAIAQIFEPFYTTKAKGMGVGLSIARSIIAAHGGQIVADNNVEGGATIRFTVPFVRGMRLGGWS